MRLGAEDVREVPPSREQSFNEASVRAKVINADIVAALVDYTGHDLTVTLGNIARAGAHFNLVRTKFGPSHIVRDIVGAA
jgi:hypothetical protein